MKYTTSDANKRITVDTERLEEILDEVQYIHGAIIAIQDADISDRARSYADGALTSIKKVRGELARTLSE